MRGVTKPEGDATVGNRSICCQYTDAAKAQHHGQGQQHRCESSGFHTETSFKLSIGSFPLASLVLAFAASFHREVVVACPAANAAAAALLVQKRRGRRAGSPVLCAPSRQTPIRFLCSCRPALLHVSPPLVARPVSRRPGLLRSRNISFDAGLFSCRPRIRPYETGEGPLSSENSGVSAGGKPRPAAQVEGFPWARSCFAALIAFRSARNAAACRLNSAR